MRDDLTPVLDLPLRTDFPVLAAHRRALAAALTNGLQDALDRLESDCTRDDDREALADARGALRDLRLALRHLGTAVPPTDDDSPADAAWPGPELDPFFDRLRI